MREVLEMLGFTKEFWAAALNRAYRTFFQVFVASVGTAVMLSEVNWRAVISASTLAAIMSVATSIATDLPEAPKKGV